MDFQTQTLPTAAFVFAALLIFFWILRSNPRLPPGPYPWPVIGNLLQLALPVHHAVKDLADKYGPILFLRLGSIPTVVVSSSEMAKQFLNTHDLVFSNRPQTTGGKYIFFNNQDLAFAQYGDHWRQMRKICVSELLNAKRIESFNYVREEELSLTIRSIWEQSKSGTIAVNLSMAISTLISNIVWRMLTRRTFSDDDLSATANGQGFKDLTTEVSATLGAFNVGDFIPYLDFLDLQGIKRRMKKTNKTFDALIEKIIEDHVDHRMAAAAMNAGREEAPEPAVKDFVDVLLDMAAKTDKTENEITREKIKAIVLGMYIGGTENTTNTLEWAMSELLRHPPAMKRLQEEIECVVGKHSKVKVSDLANMKYLHCVVKETLRLYPGAPLGLPHESVQAVTVGGYYIPKKTMVMMNVWAIGRDPNVWGKDSSEFKPERFMQEADYVDLTGWQSDFRMLPFGAGRRGCPGILMAITMLELALAQLLHVFEWRVEGDPSQVDMREAYSAALSRQIPLFAFVSLRRPSFL